MISTQLNIFRTVLVSILQSMTRIWIVEIDYPHQTDKSYMCPFESARCKQDELPPEMLLQSLMENGVKISHLSQKRHPVPVRGASSS